MEALHSRCTTVDFKLNGSKQKVAAAFFKRVEHILELEGVQYSKEVVANIITKYFPDNRRVLNELQRYSVSGTIDVGALGSLSDFGVSDLIKSIKEKKLGDARKWELLGTQITFAVYATPIPHWIHIASRRIDGCSSIDL